MSQEDFWARTECVVDLAFAGCEKTSEGFRSCAAASGEWHDARV